MISNDVVHSGLLERMGVTTRSVQSERGPRVKLHRNAKTTPAMRALIVQRIRHDQWPPAEAAAAAGISVRTAYKWLRRYRFGGRLALEDACRARVASHGARRKKRSRRLSRRATNDRRPGGLPSGCRSRARRSPPGWSASA